MSTTRDPNTQNHSNPQAGRRSKRAKLVALVAGAALTAAACGSALVGDNATATSIAESTPAIVESTVAAVEQATPTTAAEEADDSTEIVAIDGPDVPVVEMAAVATIPVPDELTAPTGITWNPASERFIVVTDSGQVAAIHGDTFELTTVIDTDHDSFADITDDVNGPLAVTANGDLVDITIDADTITAVDRVTLELDAPVTGVAIHPLAEAPIVSTDNPDGPTVWLIDDGEVVPAAELALAGLTETSSLFIQGANPVVTKASAATVYQFSPDGEVELELTAGSLNTVEGATSRDGTIIVTGTSADGSVFAAYNVQNDEEIITDPTEGPAGLTSILTVAGSATLPDGITQPSGIAFDPASNSWLVNTDQAEFFSISEDFGEILFSFDVPGFAQGDVEDIHLLEPGNAVVVSESGDYVPFTYDGATWTAGDIVENAEVDFEASAIGYDPAAGLLYAPKEGPKELVITDLDGTLVNRTGFDTSAIGASLEDYTVAGIAHADGRTWVLSEQYSTVFEIDTDGTVIAAYGLADAAEPAGLAVHDGEFWIVLDHEDSDPTPPVQRYTLP